MLLNFILGLVIVLAFGLLRHFYKKYRYILMPNLLEEKYNKLAIEIDSRKKDTDIGVDNKPLIPKSEHESMNNWYEKKSTELDQQRYRFISLQEKFAYNKQVLKQVINDYAKYMDLMEEIINTKDDEMLHELELKLDQINIRSESLFSSHK